MLGLVRRRFVVDYLLVPVLLAIAYSGLSAISTPGPKLFSLLAIPVGGLALTRLLFHMAFWRIIAYDRDQVFIAFGTGGRSFKTNRSDLHVGVEHKGTNKETLVLRSTDNVRRFRTRELNRSDLNRFLGYATQDE